MNFVLEKRTEIGSGPAGRLRRAGKIPAIAYGRDFPTTPVTVEAREFVHVLRTGEHTIQGVFEGRAETFLIQEVQTDSLGDKVLHVDLRRVASDEKVRVKVPIERYGSPKAALGAAVLEQLMMELEVECLALQIPDKLEVTVSDMEVGQVIRVKDLALPESVKSVVDGEIAVFALHVVGPEATEAEPVEGEDKAEPERIGGKKEKEEEE